MKRGDLITVSLPGDYGKPRPALVIQSDAFAHLNSVTLLPLTSEMLDAPNTRIAIQPSEQNGLRSVSYVMTDKAGTIRKERTGNVIGRISDDEIASVTRALALFLGFTQPDSQHPQQRLQGDH